MIKHFFFSAILLLCALASNAQEACNWHNNVCISYCSDVQTGTGISGVTCFKASSTSLDNPAKIYTCFNDPLEQMGRKPQILLCLPQHICSASIRVFKVVGGNFQLVLDNNNIYLDDNRDTPCDQCKYPNRYLPLHDTYANLLGKYYVQITYQCCGYEPVGFTFYYEIGDAVSTANVTMDFTASNPIETLNGDPVLDGYLPNTGSTPGPILGPFSSGVRITTAGTNGAPSQYTLRLYSVSCGSTAGTLLHTQTLPVTAGQPVEYEFNAIPNWGNIFMPNGCYKVTITGNGNCGTITKTGFFTLTNLCVSCRPGASETGVAEARSGDGNHPQPINIYPNPSTGTFQIAGAFERDFTVQLFDMTGKLLSEHQFVAGSTPVSITTPESVVNQLIVVKISDGFQTISKKHWVARQ